jgi:CubicO group peptidase (beta-lactamase class C family)
MKNRRCQLCAFALLLVVAVSVRADKVDDFIKAEMERQHLPGLSLAVIRDQKIVKVEGYGLANMELNVPARPDTVYKIGSVSKQFIASGIMLLVEEGKISLDDNISKFLDGTPDTWKSITVRHLLTHTSGIVREAPGFDPLKVQDDAAVIKTAYNLPLRFAPGEKWEYCNVGYFTLAEIIRKVSGKSWGDYLNERVFKPLNMSATRTTTLTDLIPNRASGYVWSQDKFSNADVYFALRPSGAFLSTVLDLAKWDAALNAGTVLKGLTLEQMWTPVKLNNGTAYPYGFGWELDTAGGHKQIHHGGSLPGFRSQLARFVDDKLTVIILTNGDNANASLIALRVANLYVPGIIPQRKVVKVDTKLLDLYAGQYQGERNAVLVTRAGDKLVLQEGTNPDKLELVAESDTDFFRQENPRTLYSFVKDNSGQTNLVITLEGRELARIRKIK